MNCIRHYCCTVSEQPTCKFDYGEYDIEKERCTNAIRTFIVAVMIMQFNAIPAFQAIIFYGNMVKVLHLLYLEEETPYINNSFIDHKQFI